MVWGSFANASDAWAIGSGAYGDKIEDIKLHSDMHSRLIDKSGNVILDVGIDANKSTINKLDALWGGKLKISTNYREHQANLNNEISPSIFDRKQLIRGVRVDKILQCKANLDASNRTYGLLSFISGKSTNCTAAASIALLKAGVFNIPIGVPGFLSLQMYAREFSHLSYFAR